MEATMLDEYILKIKRLKNSKHVTRMYHQLREEHSLSGWPDGRAFEHLILRAFELEGAKVTWPFTVRRKGMNLEQIDGAVRENGSFFLLEMKDYNKTVNFQPIARLRASLARRPSQAMGAVFSIRGFTEEAKVLAQYSTPVNILLWDEDDIEHGLTRGAMRSGLQKKFRHALEHGFSDYNLTMEGIP
ncbi:restriction endonuclease [Cystobacter fuscus]|nr:restriction endonuclease [Cystobacter fuscus]